MRLRKKHFAIPEMQENPYVDFKGQDHKGNWQEVFDNKNDIYLEIGSGKGGFISKMAQNNQDINFVGIDLETNALVYAGRKLKDLELENAKLLPINAEKLLDIFDQEVSKIYINFCNPWPKNRQHKRRLTHPRFLEIYKKILKKGSIIQLKTDDLDFFEDSLKYFEDSGFEKIEVDYDKKIEGEDYIVTEYESKWRSRNIPIKFAKFKFIK